MGARTDENWPHDAGAQGWSCPGLLGLGSRNLSWKLQPESSQYKLASVIATKGWNEKRKMRVTVLVVELRWAPTQSWRCYIKGPWCLPGPSDHSPSQGWTDGGSWTMSHSCSLLSYHQTRPRQGWAWNVGLLLWKTTCFLIHGHCWGAGRAQDLSEGAASSGDRKDIKPKVLSLLYTGHLWVSKAHEAPFF